jgi:hypothetical protein
VLSRCEHHLRLDGHRAVHNTVAHSFGHAKPGCTAFYAALLTRAVMVATVTASMSNLAPLGNAVKASLLFMQYQHNNQQPYTIRCPSH